MAEAKNRTSVRLDRKEELDKERPSCEGKTVVRDYQRNIEICDNCGRIVKEDIKDRGPEWRAYDQKEREERTRGGPPTTETIHDKGLSTQIDWKDRDSRGKSLSPNQRAKVGRLRKWQKKTRLSEQKDRNLSTAFSEINRMTSQLGLPQSVKEEASKIYRATVEKDLVRGHSIEGIASATLYLACRKNQLPRTFSEISEVSRADKREISRNYRFISRKLNISLNPINPVKYVARFGSDLEVSKKVQTKAVDLIRQAKKKKITSGKKPSGIAAAALYIASKMEGETKSQSRVAEVANTTDVTIRNRYKEMRDKFDVTTEN
ncbi:transcription initiation factor IIB [candidate division MSBL1 archaeon SCGC-AAA259I09]|uniref:Transcription initiation factor IIB n=1 Tax=candidate division MSBL1 archaeon SCGC-AAA259I09 TaxID=1698267 RepID=A0A133UP83_9EURY|nr:transcription initiation factor IIB [candidate division MSBL1 archaeon SCGC-AAA259I09]